MRAKEFVETKQRLDAKCWKGKHKQGTKIKGGVRVNNCVPNKGALKEFASSDAGGETGRWYTDNQMTEMVGDGWWEAMDISGASIGVPDGDLPKEYMMQTAQAWLDDQGYNVEVHNIRINDDDCDWFIAGDFHNPRFAKKSLAEELDETAAWQKSSGKNKTGGLNAKGVASYRREHPGSKLQTAVTTKPSKLKPGSKAAKRRKSFCARMGGNNGPMKKPNGDPTRKALALRKWNCESVEAMVDLILENMDHDKDNQAVPELKAALLAKKTTLQKATDDQVYDVIDKIMTRIAKSHGISGQKLHDMWVKEYDQIPDTWIMK